MVGVVTFDRRGEISACSRTLQIFEAVGGICPAGIYLLKAKNRNTRTRCEICSELTIKTPERNRRRSGIFIINFEHISHLVLVLILLTWNM